MKIKEEKGKIITIPNQGLNVCINWIRGRVQGGWDKRKLAIQFWVLLYQEINSPCNPRMKLMSDWIRLGREAISLMSHRLLSVQRLYTYGKRAQATSGILQVICLLHQIWLAYNNNEWFHTMSYNPQVINKCSCWVLKVGSVCCLDVLALMVWSCFPQGRTSNRSEMTPLLA